MKYRKLSKRSVGIHLSKKSFFKKEASSLIRPFMILVLAQAMLASTALGGTCPDTPGDNGFSHLPGHIGFVLNSVVSCQNSIRHPVDDYDNLATVNLPSNAQFSGVFPDVADRSGNTFPAKFTFAPNGGSTRFNVDTITCAAGTNTGVGTSVAEVTLADMGSCALEVTSIVGSNIYTYTATLSRTGEVYNSAGADFSIVDSTAPRISTITRFSPLTSPTNADTLIWQVTFDEAVQNVQTFDFDITGVAGTGIAVTTVNSSTYRVAISGNFNDLNGTITLGFDVAQDIQDLAGNPLINLTPTGTNNDTFDVVNIAEIDVRRPAKISIADGGSDAQGNQSAGSLVTLTYTVANTGDGTLNVTDIASANPVNVSVILISPTALNVAAGTTDTYTVQYTPTAVGDFSFDLDITNDDTDESNYDIDVSGTVTGFTVGGNISGLTNSASVTLQNNATDDLIASNNGAFTFDLPIADNDQYAVTVSNSPANPIQTCLVSGGNSGSDDGTGTISGANDDSIVITCSTESTAEFFVIPLSNGKTVILGL